MEVISIDDASSSIEVEGGVGSDVEEVINWDRELRRTSTFVTAVMILSGRAYTKMIPRGPTIANWTGPMPWSTAVTMTIGGRGGQTRNVPKASSASLARIANMCPT